MQSDRNEVQAAGQRGPRRVAARSRARSESGSSRSRFRRVRGAQRFRVGFNDVTLGRSISCSASCFRTCRMIVKSKGEKMLKDRHSAGTERLPNNQVVNETKAQLGCPGASSHPQARG